MIIYNEHGKTNKKENIICAAVRHKNNMTLIEKKNKILRYNCLGHLFLHKQTKSISMVMVLSRVSYYSENKVESIKIKKLFKMQDRKCVN